MSQLQEIRWHGRGGQGAWTASELLAKAAIIEGKNVQSFPEFGPERMGAPLAAFTRISDVPIRLHCSIYNPDVVVVLDPTLLKTVDVASGIKDEGVIVVNTQEPPSQVRKKLNSISQKVWTVPATDIAMKILNRPITNTAVLGAVSRATALVGLESLEQVVRKRFRHELAERNIAVIREAYKEAIIDDS
ncbi:MAG: 2-oxoacid:acceptor oxidoreductase family protein [Candidatus Bathyarchaeota archaeon]|nr:MAG: 2-oxoacid:acceptor oxidoreductase family protein [Candidatus Bathyarchaeota archaeon]